MAGGAGNDSYVVDNAGDLVLNTDDDPVYESGIRIVGLHAVDAGWFIF